MRHVKAWLPVALLAALMWTFSTESFSSDNTGKTILPLLRWLLPWASAATLDAVHLAIRKSAHVVEYFALSLLLFRGIRHEKSGRSAAGGWKMEWAVLAVAMAAAYGASDEIHQIFVPGRGASVHDVLIDTSGATLAQLLVWFWCRMRSPAHGADAGPIS